MLADKSLTRRIGAAIYDLYYNGPKLHMVVLRTAERRPTGSSTRSSTALSNETMLAIAKGLQAARPEAT